MSEARIGGSHTEDTQGIFLVGRQSGALVRPSPSWAPSTIFVGLIPPREHFSAVLAFEPDCMHFWRLQVDAFFSAFQFPCYSSSRERFFQHSSHRRAQSKGFSSKCGEAEERSPNQIRELLLRTEVDAYRKKRAKYLQRLLSRQKKEPSE